MFPLIAAVIAIAVIAMMWRFLDNEVARRSSEDGEPERPRPSLPMPRRTPKTRMVAPDDDPEFLRELGKKINKDRDDEQTA